MRGPHAPALPRAARQHQAEHPQASARQIAWNVEGDLPSFLPGLHTDVTLQGKGAKSGRTLIVDAKCYGKILTAHYGKQMISPSNVYQIFTYVKNADRAHTGCVSGMLLYALTDEADLPFGPNERSFTHEGNRFEVRTLDLSQPFPQIAAQLDDVLEVL